MDSVVIDAAADKDDDDDDDDDVFAAAETTTAAAEGGAIGAEGVGADDVETGAERGAVRLASLFEPSSQVRFCEMGNIKIDKHCVKEREVKRE